MAPQLLHDQLVIAINDRNACKFRLRPANHGSVSRGRAKNISPSTTGGLNLHILFHLFAAFLFSKGRLRKYECFLLLLSCPMWHIIFASLDFSCVSCNCFLPAEKLNEDLGWKSFEWPEADAACSGGSDGDTQDNSSGRAVKENKILTKTLGLCRFSKVV